MACEDDTECRNAGWEYLVKGLEDHARRLSASLSGPDAGGGQRRRVTRCGLCVLRAQSPICGQKRQAHRQKTEPEKYRRSCTTHSAARLQK